jgi:DNA-binding winged helix-turn-helix (wHTH) protein/TolB-like protein
MSQRSLNPAKSEPTAESYVFGLFRLNPSERTLLIEGEQVSLTPKAFEILTVLVRNSGHLVGKDELMREVWPDAFVEEANITQHISMLRKALGDGTDDHRYIETVPRQGYRFMGGVRRVVDEGVGVIEEQHTSHVTAGQELEANAPVKPDEEEPVTPLQWSRAKRWSNELLKGRPRTRSLAALVILAGLAAALSYFWIAIRTKQPETAAPMKTIAVLPFKSIGAEKDNEYLELGMADALITRLSNIRGIVVRPTSSVSKYTASQKDAVAVGHELGVDSVLDGSVQKVDDRIRITVRLIRVKDSAALWAATFDEKWTDVLSVQSSIAQKTAGTLALQLTGEERRLLSKRYADDTEAYQLYLRGRYSSNKWTAEGFRKGIEYFNQAIALEPDYALAYAGLADCYFGMSYLMSPKEVMPKMKEMAMKAVALDELLAEGHSSLSVALAYYDLDWSGAEKEIKRAIELNPNNAQVHLSYGDLLSNLGRFNEATSEFKKAQELDPTSAIIADYVAFHFVRSGDYDRAIEESEKALELEPDEAKLLGARGYAYLYKGEPAKALAAFRKVREILKPGTFGLEGIGRSYAAMGERAEALKVIDELREASKHQYVSSFNSATIYLQLGDKNKAIEYLGKTFEERNTNSLFLLKTDKQFDVLRSDPRFIQLLRKLNFAT